MTYKATARPDEPAAFAARIGDALVVLDLKADRYFLGLPREEPAAAHDARPSEPGHPGSFITDPEALRWVAKGCCWPSGQSELGAAFASLRCLERVVRGLDGRPFHDFVRQIQGAPVCERRRAPSPEELLASYEAARPFHSRGRICRIDAPAICLLLRRYGYPARLVFGARLEPFAAHCWAELDGLVLNEPIEAVAPYTPLLLV